MPIRVKALPPVMTDRISGPTQENKKVIGKPLSKDFENHKTKFVLPLSLHNFLWNNFVFLIQAKMTFNRSLLSIAQSNQISTTYLS